MTIPWGLIETNPVLVVLIPFCWLLWQLYVPRVLDRLFGGNLPDHEHVYETWWTSTVEMFQSNVDQIDTRVDKIGDDVGRIADTQEDLVNVTVAQSHLMNGTDGHIDVDEVEETLLDQNDTRPRDYLDVNDDEDDDEYTTDK